MIFTMGRNAEREALFEWVFKVAPREIWLYRLASRNDLAIKSLSDAHAFKVGSGPTEDASTRDLVHAGFIAGKNIDSVQAGDPDIANIQKLLRGRVEFIAVNPVSVAFAARKLGVDMKQLVQTVPVSQEGAGYWVAINKGSDAGCCKSWGPPRASLKNKASSRGFWRNTPIDGGCCEVVGGKPFVGARLAEQVTLTGFAAQCGQPIPPGLRFNPCRDQHPSFSLVNICLTKPWSIIGSCSAAVSGLSLTYSRLGGMYTGCSLLPAPSIQMVASNKGRGI